MDFRTRTLAGFGAVIAAMVATLGIALHHGRAANARLLAAIAEHTEDVSAVSRLQFDAEQMVAATRGYLITGDARFLVKRSQAQARVTASVAALERGDTRWEQPHSLKRIQQSAAEYAAALDDMMAAGAPTSRLTGQVGDAVERELLPVRTRLADDVQRAVADTHQRLTAARAEIERNQVHQQRWLIALGCLGIVMALGLAWRTTHALQKLYTSERAAAGRAEQASEAKDELLRVVAHDLRSPLSAITLKASLLRSTTRDTHARDCAESIANVAKRMGFLVQSLLDDASLEAGTFSMRREPWEVSVLVSSIAETFETIVVQKGIRFVTQLDCPQARVRGDLERMLQALTNLVANAVKFTPRGGRIELSAKRAGANVLLEVRDDGPGIAAEHVHRVFERHWTTDAKGNSGTGLGLYIAKAIVEAHEGRIWVGSAGSGAVFHIELPLLAEVVEREPFPPVHAQG